MATSTTNLSLIKPSGSDKIRIAQINQNMDILDEKIGPVGSSSLQAQMSAVTGYTTMSNGTNLNALTTKANYLVGNISQMLNAPTGAGTSGFFYVEKNSTYILQRFWGDLDKAYRFSYNNGSTWNSWVVHKTQIDSINSQVGYGVPTETLNSDLNDAITPGWYLVGNSATNTPPSLSTGKLHIEYGGTTNYVRQTYYGGYNTTIYTRTRYYSGGNWYWNDWELIAGVKKGLSVQANSSATVTLSTSGRYTVTTIGPSQATNSLTNIRVDGAGNIGVYTLVDGTSISITSNTANKLIIANSSNSAINAYIYIHEGTAT